MSVLNTSKFEHHFHPSWWIKIKPFIASPECYEIYQQLKNRDSKILPLSFDVWKAFKFTDYNKLKCLMIGESPYHTMHDGKPYADGLAFSHSGVKKLSPSLNVIYDAMEDDMGVEIDRQNDLHYLAFQDVLLLNLSLTIDKGDKDSFEWHEILWRPFIKYLFENVLDTVTGIPILIFGKPAEESIVPYLHDSQPYMCLRHPTYYARVKKPMEHKNCFSWANNIIKENNGEEIHWNFHEYADELPF